MKRSGWRKLSTAFGVTFEIVHRDIERDDRGAVRRAEFTTRAIAPNGRQVDGWGACDVFERCCEPGCTRGGRHQHCAGVDGFRAHEDAWTHFSKAEHDIPATAETRSKNRAAADLFGMGEVSAEEMQGVEQRAGSGRSQSSGGSSGGGGGQRGSQGSSGGASQQSASDAQVKMIRSVCTSRKVGDDYVDWPDEQQISDDELKVLIHGKYGVQSTKELGKKQASELIDALTDENKRAAAIAWTRERMGAHPPETNVATGEDADADAAEQEAAGPPTAPEPEETPF
ncbi:hypothetical protein ER308_07265 [Egibacter rhizosphaerae]|uniref:Uncharacterized protein n=1 Tax=Egibacter rhizosphaerae TaxID=1670831 RepID=A0A411YDP9_9ACTN|nr:hypothetical protein ER308_07265 [Egibacter rhizosphaerae]